MTCLLIIGGLAATGSILLLALCKVAALADRQADREYGVALAVERAIQEEEAKQRVN